MATFEVVAREWMQHKAGDWTESYAEKGHGSLNANIFPRLGSIPVVDITVSHVADTLAPIEERGAGEQARRTFQFISGALKRAAAKGLIKISPLANYHPKDLFSNRVKRNFPHLEKKN